MNDQEKSEVIDHSQRRNGRGTGAAARTFGGTLLALLVRAVGLLRGAVKGRRRAAPEFLTSAGPPADGLCHMSCFLCSRDFELGVMDITDCPVDSPIVEEAVKAELQRLGHDAFVIMTRDPSNGVVVTSSREQCPCVECIHSMFSGGDLPGPQ